MSGDEIITYLANIIALARADGILNTNEELACEQIYRTFNIKKSQIKEAQKLVESPDFDLRLVSRFSDQIRNLEDMILVCLADGEMSDIEKQMISDYIKLTKITDAQVDDICSGSLLRINELRGIYRCPNCQKQVSSDVKFCPQCGTAIKNPKQSENTNIAFEYPSEGISVEFAESTSATFELALKCASSAPAFQTIFRGNKKWFLATWPKSEIRKTIDLADNLKGMRNRKAYVDGKEIAWDELFGFLWCFRQKQSAFNPLSYCFGVGNHAINLWGCKQIQMDWADWAGWLCHGRFIKEDVFLFDKAKIAHELKTNLHRFRFCPSIRKNLIETVFKLLPDEVKVNKQGNWHYKTTHHETPNSIKIVEKRNYGGLNFENEFYANGVSPFGYEIAEEILRKAFSLCNITDIDCKDIIGKAKT